MDPRIGPIQGVQPNPKPTPTKKGNIKLLEYLTLKFTKLLFNKLILKTSNKKRLKKIITTPDTVDKIFELWSKKLPIKVAVAPSDIKINENPNEKYKDFFKIKLLDFNSNSLSVVPHINEMYPGINGSTQGDKKLIKPAKKAIESEASIKKLF